MQLVRSLLNSLRPRAPSPAAAAGDGWSFDPHSPAFAADPYTDYSRLRAQALPYRTGAGVIVLSRYADVVAGLGYPSLGNAPSPYAVTNARNRGRYVCADLANNILPFLDAPQHDLPRRVIAQVFHEHLKASPLDLGAIAAAHAERLVPGAQVELIAEYATPLSLAVVCDLIGIPRADGDLLRGYSEYFFYLFTRIPSVEVRAEIDVRLTRFRAYFRELVGQRRRSPEADLLTALLAGWSAEAELSESQLIDTLILLFADAVENVDRCIAAAVALTIVHPDVHARLLAEPSLASRIVNETLRYESPAQYIARVAREDFAFRGLEVEKNAVVLLMLGAANRDPEEFDHPDRFDIDRGKNTYLSFGKGKHSCIGGSLVRRETEAALTALFARFPGLRLLDERPLRFMPRPGHRWLERLDVIL